LIEDVAQGLAFGRIDHAAPLPCFRFDVFEDRFLNAGAQSVGVQRV